jgi:DinB superfamily
MKRMLALLVLFASTALLFGQEKAAQDKPEQDKTESGKPAQTKADPGKNPVTDAVREIFARQQKNLTAAIDAMPADKFGYSPTPAQMSFGHLVLHVAMSNIELCSKSAGMPPPPMKPGSETDKDRLQAALSRSFLYCESALNKVDDSKLGNPVEIFGGKQTSVAYALIALTNGWADHYSEAAMYLRLNGILPPTAEPKK